MYNSTHSSLPPFYDLEDVSFEAKIIDELASKCGATAASVIRLDRSGHNKREHEGLLFEQIVKWLSPVAKSDKKQWKRLGAEFFDKTQAWGVTGEAFLSGRVVDVANIECDKNNIKTNWYGMCRKEDKNRVRMPIKSSYCEPMELLIGTQLKEMLVVPIHSNNIVVGALKLFNHAFCKKCNEKHLGFEEHIHEAKDAAECISEQWLKTYPIRCDIVSIFIDVVDSTSFLTASGYYEGARVFQLFTDIIQKEIDKIADKIDTRPLESHVATFGGMPFLDKFTGDGVLLIFPFDRLALAPTEHPEQVQIWPFILDVLTKARKGWEAILQRPECKRMLREIAMDTRPLKIAISSGPSYLCKFGDHLSAIGRPLIEAARIIELKKIYETSFEEQPGRYFSLASQQFIDDFKIKHFEQVAAAWVLRGLPGKRLIYKVHLD